VEACIRTKFSVGFRLLEKVNVNGADTHSVFRWLRLKGSKDASAIPWNFNMFLVGTDGDTCARFDNLKVPSSIKGEIEAALASVTEPAAKHDAASPMMSPNTVVH